MNGWVKKLWHDPVWSKVISGVILGALAIVWGLWRESDFSTNLATAWAAAESVLDAVWAWLLAPIGIPCGIVLILIASAFSIEIQAARLRRRREREQASALEQTLVERENARSALAQAEADIKEMQSIRAAEQRAAAGKGSGVTPVLKGIPASKVDAQTLALLRHLLHLYPRCVSTDNLANFMGMNYAAGEKVLEFLATEGVVAYVSGSYTESGGWQLTKAGRDYCLGAGLDKR